MDRLISSSQSSRPGQLALMLLHDARRATRVDGAGDLVLLEHQEHQVTRWDRSEITEAVDLLEPALRRGRAGPYQVPAAIAASGALAGYHLLPATRADLLRRLGRYGEAAEAYREALALAATDAELRYLGRRLAETAAQM